MAVLSSKARSALPSSSFALPGGRFPIEDKIHAQKALQLAPKSEAAGNISPAEVAAIRAKVRQRYGIGGGQPQSPLHALAGRLMK